MLPEQSTTTHARAPPAATFAFHGWFTCQNTVTLSANTAAHKKRLSHHSEALPALEQQRRWVMGDEQHVFDLARHLARRFLGGRPVGVPEFMNKTNCWLQSCMRCAARLMCSCSLLAEGLLDGELLAVGRDVMRPLDDDACAAPAEGETGVAVLQPGLPHRAHATRGHWWSRDGTRLGPGRSSPLRAAVRRG